MEAAFLTAALPEPVVLLKQRLEPFSLGHQFLLARHGNRFVVGDVDTDPPRIEDLFMGVFICCETYERANKNLLDPDFDKKIVKWVKDCGTFDPLTLFVEFQRYIANGSGCPLLRQIIRPGQKPARDPGAPWLSILLAFLTVEAHMSLPEALNCPYGLATWLYCTHQESEGRCHLTNETDISEEKFIRGKMAELGMVPMNVERN